MQIVNLARYDLILADKRLQAKLLYEFKRKLGRESLKLELIHYSVQF